MNKSWLLETNGDPLGAVRQFINTIWEQRGFTAILVSMNQGNDPVTTPQIIEDPVQLDQVNPFKPLMTVNTAKMIPNLLKDRQGEELGVLLRPCEMRALIEIQKHQPLPIDYMSTICVDCLGTLPLDDYIWQAERKGDPEGLSDEALRFARQGGILAYRYRSACQMCTSPEAKGADININVIGLPVRQHILIQTRSIDPEGAFNLGKITAGEAKQETIDQHERVLFKLSQRHQHTMDRLFDTLADYLPKNVDAVVEQLDSCGECQACMDVCPICEVDHPKRDSAGHYNRTDVMEWLISCAGCGMCEQSCPDHLPLSSIFGYIRENLNKEYGYSPGLYTNKPNMIH